MFHRFLRRFILFQFSLSDAKAGEDFAEDFVRRDLSRDGTEGGEGGAQVLRQEVGGDVTVESVADGGEGSGGFPEGGGVARVGHQRAARGSDSGTFHERGTQHFEAGTRFCGDFNNIYCKIFIIS